MNQSLLQQTPEQIILFLQKETPEVIQQLFLWDFVSTFVWFVIGVTLITCFWVIIFKRVRPGPPKEPSYTGGSDVFQETWSHDAYGDIRPEIEGMLLFVGGVINVSAPFIIFLSTAWFKILIAPELYLFEYAVSIIK